LNQNNPIYSLEDIHESIRSASLVVLEGNSERDIKNLGYSDKDVDDCLCSLTADNFLKTIEYPLGKGKTTRLDVYLIKYSKATGEVDDLYIKLKFIGWIVIASFHRQR